jgi:hypothetical protein
MMRKLVFILCFLVFIFPKPVSAIYDPGSLPNNKFGIHITQEADLQKAAELINSSGGDWGYVTIVIRNDERDFGRWQNVFNQMRRLHLIPIMRIATLQQNSGWAKPSVDEIDGWVNFLGSLNWPTQNMYVIVGNEPNHAKEWGGEISPEEYAQYLNTFIDKARAKSSDFFILPAALDFSARSDGKSLEAAQFIQRMLKSRADIFDRLDGWNSHSYPNPDYSGSEEAVGKGTIASFNWEISYLNSLGVSKNFPIFVTETGWAHNMGDSSNDYLNPEELGVKYSYAYNSVWNNPRVVAVTPFIFTYLDPPFDIFSWTKKDGGFYPFVETVKALQKEDGKPIQKTSGIIIAAFTPPFVEAGGTFTGALYVLNTGQSIWNEEDLLLLRDIDNSIEITKIISFPKMEPGEKKILLFEAKAPSEKRQISGNITLFEDKKMISNAKAYNTNSYLPADFLKQLLLLRNSVASALWFFRINILGF